MKYLILIFLLCICCSRSFSQTYITPSLGYDFMSMPSIFIDPNFHGFEILSPPYSIKGLQYGLEVEQKIYNKFSALIYLGFAQRNVDANMYGIISIDGFKFDYWRGGILLNYRILNCLSIGGGYDYNQLKDLTYIIREQTYSNFKPLMIDQGLNLSVRGHWKNIELKGYFHGGINSNISDSAHELSIRPVNYFGVSLGYRIKIINSLKKSKKTKCSTF